MNSISKIWQIVLLCSVLISTGCKKDEPADTPSTETSPNILLIISDDMGKDATDGFPEGNNKPNTPHLNSLKNSGITFNNFWSNPTCSPTRAAILTGKYGYRTGVKWAGDKLSTGETSLHKYISQETNNTYATGLIGKWHLSGPGIMLDNPEDMGIDHYAGLLGGAVQDYYDWDLTENNQRTTKTSYITEKITDLSINWINEQDKPWFLWVAYNAPHTPFHTPPAEMHSQGSLPDYTDGTSPLPYYFAAIEAMDYQIGRLLDHIPESEKDNTVIIYLADNGTPNQVAQTPYSNSTVKGSLYQGGINMPLFVSGSDVDRTGMEDDNLITATDLFATIAELAGVTVEEIHDSKSFKNLFSASGSHRQFQYSEMDDGTQDLWAISNGLYKIIADANGSQKMYNLATDPYEAVNLLDGNLTSEASEAKASLENELANIRN
jgi:arylsulfatase B